MFEVKVVTALFQIRKCPVANCYFNLLTIPGGSVVECTPRELEIVNLNPSSEFLPIVLLFGENSTLQGIITGGLKHPVSG